MKKLAGLVLAVFFVLSLSSDVFAQDNSNNKMNKSFLGFGLGLESLILRNDPGPSDYTAKFNLEFGRTYVQKVGGKETGEGRILLTLDNFFGSNFNVGFRNENSLPWPRLRFGAGAMLSSYKFVHLGKTASGEVVVIDKYRDWSFVPYFNIALVVVKDKYNNGNDLNLNLRLGSGLFSFNRDSSPLSLYKSVSIVGQARF